MNTYKYTLQKYNGSKTKFDCPVCNCKKTFTKYIDIETSEYLNDRVGRCDKIDKCGYHYKPKQYFDDTNILTTIYKPATTKRTTKQKLMFTIPNIDQDKSLTNYDNNNFALILMKLFDYVEAVRLLTLFEIGTSNKWNGSNIFWQIDEYGIVRTGKIMLYNTETYKRVKEPYNHISWVHTDIINEDTHEIKQCFFGLHQLYFETNKTKTIGIVESEKSAIICSHFMPKLIWLAAGNINGLSIDKFNVLKGKNVILFPDLNKGYDIWQQKANEFKAIANISVSNYLKSVATAEDIKNGLDLVDYLLETNKN